MKRLIVFATVLAVSWLGLAASSSSVDAKAPGPNGEIAFRHVDPSLPDNMIRTVNPDGTHQVSVHLGEEFQWSPDGSTLAIGGGDGTAALIVNPDTGAVRKIKLPDPTLQLFCSAWSPDAERLACGSFSDDASRNGIYTIRISDGRGLTRITSNPRGLDFIGGDWSPDGTRLVFTRWDSTRPRNTNQAIFVVNLDGTGLRRISPWGAGGESGLLTYVLAGWSPDGNKILFSENGSLFTVHPDGTGLTKIVLEGISLSFACSSACALDPGWSPDGTKIVFAMFTAAQGAVNIYTANADGSGVYQLTHETSQDFHDGSPDWGSHPLAT